MHDFDWKTDNKNIVEVKIFGNSITLSISIFPELEALCVSAMMMEPKKNHKFVTKSLDFMMACQGFV